MSNLFHLWRLDCRHYHQNCILEILCNHFDRDPMHFNKRQCSVSILSTCNWCWKVCRYMHNYVNIAYVLNLCFVQLAVAKWYCTRTRQNKIYDTSQLQSDHMQCVHSHTCTYDMHSFCKLFYCLYKLWIWNMQWPFTNHTCIILMHGMVCINFLKSSKPKACITNEYCLKSMFCLCRDTVC